MCSLVINIHTNGTNLQYRKSMLTDITIRKHIYQYITDNKIALESNCFIIKDKTEFHVYSCAYGQRFPFCKLVTKILLVIKLKNLHY